MKKKIIAVTGSRSEYDIIFPVLNKLNKQDFEVSLIVAGSHLSSSFGYTVSEIEKDNFCIDERIHNLIDSDQEIGKIKGTGLLIQGLSEALHRLMPDFVMVVGDREEAIASGIVCTYLGIPLIHFCGGDKTSPKEGDVDEQIRHATSKLASVHFTMNQQHKDRLLKMGEEDWRVCNIGNPALDRFNEIEVMDRVEINQYFGIGQKQAEKSIVLVIQHVISGEVKDGSTQIKKTLDAVTSLDCNCIINYPNSDMGSRELIKVLESFRKLPNVRVFKHIPRKQFVNLLRNIDLLVGNSSMALLEGAFLKIPAISVGERNLNRINGGNVVFVKNDASEIREVAEKILFDKHFSARLKNCKPVYGDGNASTRVLDYLRNLNKTKTELLAKDITY